MGTENWFYISRKEGKFCLEKKKKKKKGQQGKRMRQQILMSYGQLQMSLFFLNEYDNLRRRGLSGDAALHGSAGV